MMGGIPVWTAEDEDDVETYMQRYRDKERQEAPYGRDPITREPAIPTVTTLVKYNSLEISMHACAAMPQDPEYEDPSKPEERRGWFFYEEPNRPYPPQRIHFLEEMFVGAIVEETRVLVLLNIFEDVKNCERLPKHVKDNLLLNIRNKL